MLLKTYRFFISDKMHRPYKEVFNRPADFRISYRIYTQEEDGRYPLPFQGIRWNFWYDHPEHKKGQLFMIYPEFEDENEQPITDLNLPINRQGFAKMWILNDDYINYHKGKMKNGTIGYFMEGNRKVGECEVIELLNLKS
ncbi:hypothetical protein I5M27_12690 [Adhaeribacter sp. BT258]|uniref:Uncharacterized protein n=1 Tax=Adhaeribacter terrigena TaxID=2793070 RepID=A0ABS1C391_9BACT|nr:hypothetical protein [Adhaeribacter terrigena]MBK0403849.1 hypothetical protein [Adhaeribacter terrigena]